METYSSSAEDLAIKTRKPYTITKQRERWTEEEHNRFLEALKLYGRAWQRIEEHIGTKTAVQIRSHAQKFFSKLEKEALAKGIPVEQAIDIEIPPPRPKRKPSNPYPRKTGAVGAPNTQAASKDGKQATPGSLHSCKQLLDLEKEPLLEKSVGDGGVEDTEDKRGDKDCSKFAFSQETPSTFASSANRSSVTSTNAEDSYNYGDTSRGTHVTDGLNRSYQPNEAVVGATQNNGTENEARVRGAKSYPRHAPIQVINGSARTYSHHLSADVSYQESTNPQIGVHPHPILFMNPSVSPAAGSPITTSNANQEDYSSLLQMSSTFASALVSTLLQNPTAHAAASYAAAFWPGRNVDVSSDSHQPPSMAAIAAATMAAATAWWAAHGLLPVCAPPAHGFSCPPGSTANVDPQNTCHQPVPTINERGENNGIQGCSSQDQQLHQGHPEAMQAENSGSKSPTLSSSDTGGDNLDLEANGALTSTTTQEKNNSAVVEQNDSGKNNRKQVDRSSCGSNSSSEVETDALGKHENSKEENKEADAASDSYSRRFRNNINLIDSRKEVSEEGRVAFSALFLREILPQSFSPPHDVENGKKNNDNGNAQNTEMNNDALRFDLNAMEPCSSHNETDNRLTEDIKAGEGLLTLGLAQGNPRTWRTGFKPYKRCSVEARESSTSQDQEKGAKRLRLEDQASA